MKNFVSKPVTKLDPIEFSIEDKPYTFTPGKKSGALVELVQVKNEVSFSDAERTRRLLDWLADGLNPEHNDNDFLGRVGHTVLTEGCQACALQADLLDRRPDGLALETVLDAVNWLIGEVTGGRPTSSPSA